MITGASVPFGWELVRKDYKLIEHTCRGGKRIPLAPLSARIPGPRSREDTLKPGVELELKIS